jgi:trk system potassium uptake protein TrkA
LVVHGSQSTIQNRTHYFTVNSEASTIKQAAERMHVVILGAGTVGTSIAEMMCANSHNVVVLDASQDALVDVEEKLDVQTIRGSACEAITLFQAGVQIADLCLAVTNRDEVNLVGGSLAKAMGARRSVSRVYDPAYRDISTFDYQRHFGIDRLMSLEHLTALELAKGIRAPGVFAVENFARGGIQVREVQVEERPRAAGQKLKELGLPPEVRIGLISNEAGTRIPGADDMLQAGDRIALIGKDEDLIDIKKWFEKRTPPALSITIAGGGEIGFHLARALQKSRFRVQLMESAFDRCQYLSERLPRTTVLNADATRRGEMEEARVGQADVFVAAMGRDEDNIVCGVEARALGADRILSVVRRPDYANVLEKLGIDVAVSPREVLAREVLGMVDAGPVLARSEIATGEAFVWEVEVEEGAPITASPLRMLQLQGCLIAAIIRDQHVTVAGGDDQLRAGDTVVVLLPRDAEAQTLKWFTKG